MWVRAALVTVLALALVYLAVSGWLTYRQVTRLRAHVRELTQLRSPVALSAQLALIQQDVKQLDRRLALPLAAAPKLGWLPRVGPSLAAAPVLWQAGQDLLDYGVVAGAALAPAAEAMLQGQLEPEQAFGQLDAQLIEQGPVLAALAGRGHDSVQRIAALDASALLPQLRGPVAQVQSLSPVITAAVDGLPLLPAMMGASEPRTYLLLAQNNHELRATGGFISAMGTLQCDGGLPRLTSFVDSYQVENWEAPHPDPPEALRRTMGLDLWVTRDGNWWPDFPTSARAVADLYTLNQDTPVAGVVAVDMAAAERLLEVLTPLPVAGGRIERGGVGAMFRSSWSLPEGSLVTAGTIYTPTRHFEAIEVQLIFAKEGGHAWFDSVVIEPLATETNLVPNPSFEQDSDGDGWPDAWQGQGMTEADGLVLDQPHHDRAALHLLGEPATRKVVSQTIPVSGAAGAGLRLSAMSRALDVPTAGGPYALSVSFVRADGSRETVGAGFPALTHGWATAGSDRVLAAWWRQRKDFMNQATQAALAKVLSAPEQVPWPALLREGLALLQERHIQISLFDAQAAALLAQYGWDGALVRQPGDYLLVVDSNVGYNKVTANVSVALSYTVDLSALPHPVARLELDYHNQSSIDVDVCDKFRQYVPSYDLMTQGCYWNYVRVYAPQGARLLEATGADEAFDTLEELDLTVFAAPLTLEPGEARRVTLVYALPESAVAGRPYSLYAQKQAGSQAHPLQVTLLGAQGALLAEDGLDVLRSPERIQLTGTLRQDRWLTLQPEG